MFKPTLKNKTSINIIPMVDVIFFLLVFFMLFTSFRTNPSGIDLQLPKAVTVTEQTEKNLVVDINQSGEVYYQGKKVSLSNLNNVVKKEFNNNNNLVVIINADRDTRYRNVVSVMDNIRQVGVFKIALAAEKEQ